MTYEEAVEMLESNTRLVMDFEEYVLIGGRPYLALEIKDAMVINYIKERQELSIDEIKELYGEDANIAICYQHPYIRIVVEYEGELAVIHLNKTYFTSGLQKINLREQEEETTEGVKPWFGIEQLT